MRGRPIKANTLKKLGGTLRKDRIKVPEVKFEKIKEVPKPEAWLDTKAKKRFKQFAELLIQKGLLTEANLPLVAIMAQEYATYEEATKNLKKDGKVLKLSSGYKQQSPWLSIRNSAFKNYREIAGLFGFDPISTQKVGKTEEPKEDDFSKLYAKYNL